jgi:uncharacterized protein (DUF58 family)
MNRSRLFRWLRPPRKFRVTREGKWFIGGTLLLGFAAVNGGINLLFLLFGMMLSLLIANGILAEICLRQLVTQRHVPPAFYAGKPFLMGISARNQKRWFSTFSLEVEDLSADGTPIDRRCFFLKIPAGREQETSYRRTLHRRGLHHLQGLRLSTRFPFNLLRRSLDVPSPLAIIVYPALIPIQTPWLYQSLSLIDETGAPRRSRGGEFHGLREMRPDDDPRDIHFRTSARRGRLFVREFEADQGHIVLVALQEATLIGSEREPAVELAVSAAASIALALLRRGYQVGLWAGSARLAPERSGRQENRILHTLALYQPGMEAARASSPHATLIRVTPALGHPLVESVSPQGQRRTA